jgi:nicotinamide mononucleotide transporter
MSITLPTRENGFWANLLQGTILATVLTALSYFVAFRANWINPVTDRESFTLLTLEAFAVFTSYVCTYLCVMERRINYPIGAVSTAAYCVLFWRFHLNASMAINAFLTVYLVYGWIRWRADDNTLPITRMSAKDWLIAGAVTAVGYGVVVALANAFDGTLVWTDSVILVGTLLAQWTLDNKRLETWAVWVIVNIFAIYTYFNTDLALVGFQYIFFLLNAFWAFSVWLRRYTLVDSHLAEDGLTAEQFKEKYL